MPVQFRLKHSSLGALSALMFFIVSACAPTSTGQAPKANLSPRQKAARADGNGKDGSADTSTTDGSGKADASGKKVTPATAAAAKCRLTDMSKITADQASEPMCDSIVVKVGDGGAIKPDGLVVQDNGGPAYAFTQNDFKADPSGRKILTFVSNTTAPKTKDGKNLLQLGFILPDAVAAIDMSTFVVALAGSDAAATNIDQEKADQSNRDKPILYSLAKSKDTGAAVNLLVRDNAIIPNIGFVVTVSYQLKSTTTQQPAAQVQQQTPPKAQTPPATQPATQTPPAAADAGTTPADPTASAPDSAADAASGVSGPRP